MKVQIIGDSCLDMTEELQSWLECKTVPFQIIIGQKIWYDDENADIEELLQDIDAYPETPKTAAPSPYDFVTLVEDDTDAVFFITVSSRLSACYSAALLAAQLLAESSPALKTHVLDSRAASAGQAVLAMEIRRLAENGKSFEEIVSCIEDFRNDYQLYFLLDNLDTLVKNGRMSKLAGVIASFLHIKPILRASKEGEIVLVDKARTFTKGLDKMADRIISVAQDVRERYLVITHCKALERAQYLADRIMSKIDFKKVLIIPMKGLSSTYANRGGIICSF